MLLLLVLQRFLRVFFIFVASKVSSPNINLPYNLTVREFLVGGLLGHEFVDDGLRVLCVLSP